MYTFRQPAFGVGRQHPPSTMLPTDHDAILQNVSSHVAGPEPLRRLSIHSSSTTNSSKRGTARITKQTSATNSPHSVQRRRTTANHTTRAHPRIVHDSQYQTREQSLRNHLCLQGSISSQRPMSWHPGSKDYRSPGTSISTTEPAIGNTIAELENLAVSSTVASSVQQSIQDAFDMGYVYPVNAPTTTYQQSPTTIPGYGTLGPASEPAYDSYPTYSVSDVPQYPPMPQVATYDAYPAASYRLPPQWPNGQDYAGISQMPQALSTYFPAQGAVNTTRQSKSTPRVTRKRSQELVGMGLYDDKASDFMSSLSSVVSEDPNREPPGKGLKLEETWQPPNEAEDEAEDEEEDDVYSSDDAEEVEEGPPSFTKSASTETQTAFYPAYGDLSNQSFFFNDDEDYSNNDQYADYLAYGQGLSAAQLKPPQNLGMENYLWF